MGFQGNGKIDQSWIAENAAYYIVPFGIKLLFVVIVTVLFALMQNDIVHQNMRASLWGSLMVSFIFLTLKARKRLMNIYANRIASFYESDELFFQTKIDEKGIHSVINGIEYTYDLKNLKSFLIIDQYMILYMKSGKQILYFELVDVEQEKRLVDWLVRHHIERQFALVPRAGKKMKISTLIFVLAGFLAVAEMVILGQTREFMKNEQIQQEKTRSNIKENLVWLPNTDKNLQGKTVWYDWFDGPISIEISIPEPDLDSYRLALDEVPECMISMVKKIVIVENEQEKFEEGILYMSDNKFANLAVLAAEFADKEKLVDDPDFLMYFDKYKNQLEMIHYIPDTRELEYVHAQDPNQFFVDASQIFFNGSTPPRMQFGYWDASDLYTYLYKVYYNEEPVEYE